MVEEFESGCGNGVVRGTRENHGGLKEQAGLGGPHQKASATALEVGFASGKRRLFSSQRPRLNLMGYRP